MHGNALNTGSKGPFLNQRDDDVASGGAGKGPNIQPDLGDTARAEYSKLPKAITDKLTQLGVVVSSASVDLGKVYQAVKGLDQNIRNFEALRDRFFVSTDLGKGEDSLVARMSKEICSLIDRIEGLNDRARNTLKDNLPAAIDQIANSLLVGEEDKGAAKRLLIMTLADVVAQGKIKDIPEACDSLKAQFDTIVSAFKDACSQHPLNDRIYIPKGLTKSEILVALVLNANIDPRESTNGNSRGRTFQVLETLVSTIPEEGKKPSFKGIVGRWSDRYNDPDPLQTGFSDKDFITVARVLDEIEQAYKKPAREEKGKAQTPNVQVEAAHVGGSGSLTVYNNQYTSSNNGKNYHRNSNSC